MEFIGIFPYIINKLIHEVLFPLYYYTSIICSHIFNILDLVYHYIYCRHIYLQIKNTVLKYTYTLRRVKRGDIFPKGQESV